jgi:stage III sporulation protein SpoIIIAA
MAAPQATSAKRAKRLDMDVRQAVLSMVLRAHRRDPNVRVVEELGLEHGTTRVDIAGINEFPHG